MTDAVKDKVAQDTVSLTIDNVAVTAPAGTLVVDAAKMVGIDIPVFCYHPKMEPVGMCRMCLVDIGLPVRNRASGEIELEKDGSPKLQFGRNLETGCTVTVQEGMVVNGYSQEVTKARQDVVEFLLTSHPLDCPICDKGGECPLQNLTIDHGKGETRYIYSEKIQLDKHVPLGDLIYLDRERCIQCARCTRFQEEIAGDPVIGFSQRGRELEIITFSEPGFDSYWSGNTTDICPVGALTTTDFRFGARPWEMQSSASICNHCPVGCNLTLNTRREAKAGGENVIKRVMPRQNESVNEIWICDKGRFGYHYTEQENRLTQPLVRKGDRLTPTTWDKALNLVAEKMKAAGSELVTLAGGRLSNEDLFNLHSLSDHLGANAYLNSYMSGGDLIARVGVGKGTNFSDMGPETAILVIASDLEEEAPLWWLRVKQAAERGATLIVANPRRTKLDRYANHTLRYGYTDEDALVLALLASVSPKHPDMSTTVKKLSRDKNLKIAAKAFAEAENGIVIYGSDGISLPDSEPLAKSCANLLVATGHAGRANNGLIPVWDSGNAQGAWDMGLQPNPNLASDIKNSKMAYIVAADPAEDDPALARALKEADFVVVQELQMTATAQLADVVLPVRAFTERAGTYTSGERRVQRFYPALPAPIELLPDFGVTADIAARLDLELEGSQAGMVFEQIAESIPDYADLDYSQLAETEEQWPQIGRDDVYYGGTSYRNTQGMGVQLSCASERGESVPLTFVKPNKTKVIEGLSAVPVTRLYDRGSTLNPSHVLKDRVPKPFISLHPDDANKLTVNLGDKVRVSLNSKTKSMLVKLDNSLPAGTVLVPRNLGLPITEPTPVQIKVN